VLCTLQLGEQPLAVLLTVAAYSNVLLQVLTNVWRVCHSFVESSCLVDMDPDMCVFQAFQRLLHGQQQQQDRTTGPSAGVTAGIVTGGTPRAAPYVGSLLCTRSLCP